MNESLSLVEISAHLSQHLGKIFEWHSYLWLILYFLNCTNNEFYTNKKWSLSMRNNRSCEGFFRTKITNDLKICKSEEQQNAVLRITYQIILQY